jgi:hypothetical protein
VHLGQKVPFVFACFQASAAPRPENSDSDEKDALFGLDTQITILVVAFFFVYVLLITSSCHCVFDWDRERGQVVGNEHPLSV